MPSSLNNLRNIIDVQDVKQLEAFITDNPEIDYDSVCANGASALWWALMPPPGKKLNTAIIDCLLTYRKNDGSHLISPVQEHAGLTPRRYLEHNLYEGDHLYAADYNFAFTLRLITDAENHYERPQAHAHAQRGLAAIAADTQSAHDSTVSKLSRANIISLYQYYILEKSCLLDEECIQIMSQEIEDLIKKLKKTAPERAKQMLFGHNFCYNNSGSFAFTPPTASDESFSLTLAELIALNWLAANEQDAALLPDDATDEQALEGRQNAVLATLYDIATAYGKNKASCAGGACSRLGMTLASQHKLVNAFIKGEKLKGDAASLVALNILGKNLEQLSKNSPDSYWAVIRYTALGLKASAEEEEHYADFIAANKSRIKAQLVEENIEVSYIDGILEVLEDDYPYTGHHASYQLIELMRLMNVYQLDLTVFDSSATINEAIATATKALAEKQLAQSDAFIGLKRWFGGDGDSEDFALETQFIYHWLEQTRLRGEVNNFRAFIKNPEPSEFSKACFMLSVFSTNKATLIENYPAQAKWLEHLTDQQVIELLCAIYEDRLEDEAIDPVNSDFMASLILTALNLGLTTHMCLEGVRFEQKDLRDFDFSGTNLTNATFVDCLLPFTGHAIDATGVNLINCQLPHPQKNPNDKDFARLFLNLCCDRNYALSSLTIRFLLTKMSREWLERTDNAGKNALIRAAELGHTEIVQAILDSHHCSQALLENTDYTGETALSLAANHGHTEIVQVILDSNHCSNALLEKTNELGSTALFQAILYNHTPTTQAILDSSHCSQALLEKAYNGGDTVLLVAAWRRDPITIQAILDHHHCSQALLEKSNFDGQTILSLAARFGPTATIQAILDHRHCSLALLEKTVANRNSRSFVARSDHLAMVKKIKNYFAYFKLWEKASSQEEKVIALLDDYCKGSRPVVSRLSVFAHGHFNRHHKDAVRRLVTEYKKADKTLDDILITLDDMEKKENGSLSRRLEFISTRYSVELEDMQQAKPRMEGP